MKTILVDDEPLALDFLEFQINKMDRMEVIGKFNNLDIEKNAALLEEVDVIFLDIEMPEINGLELAEKILENNADISIVFVTAYQEYAVQAFELNALDYILKPIQLERLNKTIQRVEMKSHNPIPKLGLHHVMRIYVSRKLRFELTKGQSEYIQWRTTKSEELFLYLLHNHNKVKRKSELIELLWEDFEEEKAFSQLYTAIYHIRKTLKRFNNHLQIKNVGGGYVLTTKNVFIDLFEWEKQIKSLPPVSNKTIDDYEEKMNLYSDSYLQEYDYLWAEVERYRLEERWIKIAYQLADYYDLQGNLEMADTWYSKICLMRPEEEEPHFSLMKLYHKLGQNLKIEQQYQHLKKALEELGLYVSPHITKWYQQRNAKSHS